MWSRLKRLIWRLLHVGAWGIVVTAAVLVFCEQSGLLTHLLRQRVARELGPLGDGFAIGSVELRWFEPGVLLRDVRLEAPVDESGDQNGDELAARGGAAPRPDILRLDTVHLSFRPGLDLTQPLRRVVVRGGRLHLSDELSRAVELLGAEAEPDEGSGSSAVPWEQLLSPPPMVFSGIAVELALPDERAFELGRASLLADPLVGGGYQLLGRLEPRLGGAIDETSAAVHIDGRLQPDGVQVQATARRLTFASEALEGRRAADVLPVERCAGSLTVAASLALTGWGTGTPQLSGSLRTSLVDGELLVQTETPPIEALDVELDAAFDLQAGERLWRREAWSVRARGEARWLDSPVEAFARFGRDIPGDDWVHAWARVPSLPLDLATLDALAAPKEARDLVVGLEPEGRADVALDFRLADPPPLAGGGRFEPRLAAHLAVAEDFGATYRGLYDPRSEQRFGFPLPVSRVGGHVLFGHDPRDVRPDHVRIDVAGQPGAGRGRAPERGRVHVHGALFSPIDPGPDFLGPELDLRIDLRDLPLDANARLALSDHPGTRELWDIWNPTGGRIDTAWRLYGSPTVGGMAAVGDVALRDASLRWKELPVPLAGIDGALRFQWAEQPVYRLDDPRGLRKHRPMGVRYRFSNLESPERAGVRAAAFGIARQRSVGAQDVGPEVETRPWIQALEVQVPELFLRGQDWDVLAAKMPELDEVTRSLGAKGAVSARYRGRAPQGALEFVSDVEAQPLQVEVTPDFFRRRTRELAGRILARTRAQIVDVGQEPPPGVTEARFHLAGRWSQGVELSAVGTVPAAGMARVQVLGAGIDPTNNAFRGALLRSLAEGDGGSMEDVDLSSRTLTGLLDVGVEARFEVGVEAEPENAYRVYLRGNTLETESLELGGLRGVLEQREDVLRAEFVRGELAGHPLELRDVLVLRLSEAAVHPEGDPLFAQPGIWKDPDGVGIQARLSTRDLPLDGEHLSALLSPEALAPLSDSGTWSGQLDVRDARILVTGEDDGSGIVAVKGLFRPHDLTTRLGVPIRVRAADLTLGELILEGGRVRGWGEITNLDAELAGRRLDDARMVVGYVDGRLTIDNLAGAFEGGELVALGAGAAGSRKALGIDLSPPYRFDLALSLEDVELDRLLRGVFPSSIADQGLVDLQLSLSGTPGDVRGLSGVGSVRLDEGRLWSIPVARALFYQLGIPDTAIFDRMRARFQLRDGRLEGSYLEIKSSLLNLIGSGWLDLDGRLAMDLEVRYSILDRLGSLNRLLYWLNDNLWRVAARGDLTRPRVSIRNVLLELFGGFEDAPRRELPLPGISDLGPRF